MSVGNLYTPRAVVPLYSDLVPAYQAAFAAEPWYEVSKCADRFQRCAGGLSSLALGATCELCDNCLVRPAYETDEMIDRFNALGASRPTAWYVEQNGSGVTLAAVAWAVKSGIVANEKYSDVPAMTKWLEDKLGSDEIMWLDEVFANKELKPKGNLQNFGTFVRGLARMLDMRTVAYRTIEPRMLTVAERDFGENAEIFCRQNDVPDRRDFVVIKLNKE